MVLSSELGFDGNLASRDGKELAILGIGNEDVSKGVKKCRAWRMNIVELIFFLPNHYMLNFWLDVHLLMEF